MTPRLIRYFVSNAFFLWLQVMAVQQGVTWASNLILFVVWIWFALVLLVYLATVADPRKIAADTKVGRGLIPVPTWFDVVVDVIIVSVFAAGGWFITAVAWVVIAFLTNAMLDMADRARNELRAERMMAMLDAVRRKD